MNRMTCLGIAWEVFKMTIQAEQPKTINHTHLTHEDRNLIQEELENRSSLKRIAEVLAKDPSIIAKEIHKHRAIRASSSFNKGRNYCKQELTCRKKDVCPGKRYFYNGDKAHKACAL